MPLQNESTQRASRRWRNNSTFISKPVVTSYAGGVELTPNGLKFQSAWRAVPKRGGGRRGKIHGFSLASARRLRETLFRCNYRAPGMGITGVCLTLPPEAAPGVGAIVWCKIQKQKSRLPGLVSAVWRKELQRNGREHYHVVLWTDNPDSLQTAGALVRLWCRLVAKECKTPEVYRRMLEAHCRGNDALFDVQPSKPSAEDIVQQTSTWREVVLPQIVAQMPCLTAIDRNGHGVQYLVEHGSQRKGYQMWTTGRPWGVWFRSRLPKLPMEASLHVRLSQHEEVEVARVLRRLARYPIPAPCCFGWKWHRARRFTKGTHVVASAKVRDAIQHWMEGKDHPSALNIYTHKHTSSGVGKQELTCQTVKGLGGAQPPSGAPPNPSIPSMPLNIRSQTPDWNGGCLGAQPQSGAP